MRALGALPLLSLWAAALAAQTLDSKAPSFREVSFETADGARIYANLYEGGDHAQHIFKTSQSKVLISTIKNWLYEENP